MRPRFLGRDCTTPTSSELKRAIPVIARLAKLMSKIRNTLAFLALGIGLHAGRAQAAETIPVAYQTGCSPLVGKTI